MGICPVHARTGGCNISEKIRDLVLDIENREMSDRTEALLAIAARMWKVIAPAVRKEIDCFIDSSLAYRGWAGVLGSGRDGYQSLYDGRYDAGQNVFLDFPPHLAFERMSKKRA